MKFKQKIKLNHNIYKIFHYLMSWMEVFLDHTRNFEQGVNIIFLYFVVYMCGINIFLKNLINL